MAQRRYNVLDDRSHLLGFDQQHKSFFWEAMVCDRNRSSSSRGKEMITKGEGDSCAASQTPVMNAVALTVLDNRSLVINPSGRNRLPDSFFQALCNAQNSLVLAVPDA